MDVKPFRRRTRLLWAHCDLRQALRHCSSKKGICDRTHVMNGANNLKAVYMGNFELCWHSRILTGCANVWLLLYKLRFVNALPLRFGNFSRAS